ncbi:MAG: acyl-CoA thioesterase [Hyphomicrobiales bacterium]|nr:acyl-CoA thioesterase [Hyphomicrobiales bacterium]
MIMYSRELTVPWGESDPFGLVYFPRMLAWFNDTEHELLRALGFPTNKLIAESRTAFVMGDIHFRFIGPAAYGDRIRTIIQLAKIGRSTLHWDCKAVITNSGATVTEGRAIRIHAQIQEDGNLKAVDIPEDLRKVLTQSGSLIQTEVKNGDIMDED